MNSSHTQLKAIVLMLILVLGITSFERVESISAFLNSEEHTASVFNPIASFLGIPMGQGQSLNEDQRSEQADMGGSDGDYDTGIGSFLVTPAPVNDSENSLGASSGSSSSSASGGTLANRTPTLICLPSVIDEGEEALIMWACRDGAHTATSDTIATDGKTVGAVRVRPGEDTTYVLTCENDIADVDNTSAECHIDISKPALAIIATPSSVAQGGTVTLSWKTKDTESCFVTSEAGNFERRGVEGDAVSPRLVRNTTFKLTCETITGVLEERSVTVGVN